MNSHDSWGTKDEVSLTLDGHFQGLISYTTLAKCVFDVFFNSDLNSCSNHSNAMQLEG